MKAGPGDLLAARVRRKDTGANLLVASFHGDTAGLATPAVLGAVAAHAAIDNAPLIFGLDANTYAHAKAGKQLPVADFLEQAPR